MAAAGLPVRPDWYAMGPTTPERVRAALDAMLTGPEPVTALFAGNNRVTVTAVRVLSGREQPVALVGFDDFELADLLNPPVTVVAQDAPGMGRSAAQHAVPPARRHRARRAEPDRAPGPADRPRLGRDPAVLTAVLGPAAVPRQPAAARYRPASASSSARPSPVRPVTSARSTAPQSTPRSR